MKLRRPFVSSPCPEMKMVCLLSFIAMFVACERAEYSDKEMADTGIVSEYIVKNVESLTALRDIDSKTGASSTLVFKMGTTEGGTAALFEKYCPPPGQQALEIAVGACFWVKDGQIFTVGEKAKSLCPDLKPAPSEVTVDKVLQVVH